MITGAWDKFKGWINQYFVEPFTGLFDDIVNMDLEGVKEWFMSLPQKIIDAVFARI